MFVGVVLLIGWFVCLRLTLRSMGGLGFLLANAFLAALYWLVASWGWLPSENVAAISWLGLFSVAAILAVGMSWSRWRRALRRPAGLTADEKGPPLAERPLAVTPQRISCASGTAAACGRTPARS